MGLKENQSGQRDTFGVCHTYLGKNVRDSPSLFLQQSVRRLSVVSAICPGKGGTSINCNLYIQRHSHFGGRNSTSNASPSITNRPVATSRCGRLMLSSQRCINQIYSFSRQYFGENISLDESSVTPIQATTLERLVELARTLVKGALNEVLLASVGLQLLQTIWQVTCLRFLSSVDFHQTSAATWNWEWRKGAASKKFPLSLIFFCFIYTNQLRS